MSVVSQSIKSTSTAGQKITVFGNVNSAIKNIEHTVLLYTIPINKKFVIIGGSGSGKTDGIFKLYINNNIKEVLFNAWTTRNVRFGVQEEVLSNIVIKITAEHMSNFVHDFYATIFGKLI